MHIVAIAWLYVTLLMAMTESNITAGLLNWILFGLAPLLGFLWIMAKLRPRRAGKRNATATASDGNKADPVPPRNDHGSDQDAPP
jgi:hypothetical protein